MAFSCGILNVSKYSCDIGKFNRAIADAAARARKSS